MEVSRNRLRVVVGILLGLAFAREARAGDVTVAWTGPPDCDGGARIERRIADDLGSTHFPATHVAIAVASRDAIWHGALTIAGATSLRRELSAPSCETLADAAAIVTVVALDPFAVAQRVRAAATAPTAPAPAPARDVVAPARAPGVTRRRPMIALRVELGASAFALPRTAAIVGLAPLVELAHWRFELPVRWHVPFSEPVRSGVTVRMQQLTVGPRGCAMPGRGAIRMLVCGGLDAGLVAASGRGNALVRPHTAIAPWLTVNAAVGVRWRVVRRFATWLAIEGAVTTLRPAFHLEDAADVYRAPPATLLVAIGGELHFVR